MSLSDELFKGRKPQELKASVPAASPPELKPELPLAQPQGAAGQDKLLQEIEALKARLQAQPQAQAPSWQGWALTGLAIGVVILCGVLLRGIGGEDGKRKGEKGLHVLVVYESEPGATSDEQRIALASVMTREWLDEHCAKIGKDEHPAWQMFDKNENLENYDPVWARLMAKPRESLPWLIMSGGKREVSEPMVDGDVEEFLKQLEKGK